MQTIVEPPSPKGHRPIENVCSHCERSKRIRSEDNKIVGLFDKERPNIQPPTALGTQIHTLPKVAYVKPEQPKLGSPKVRYISGQAIPLPTLKEVEERDSHFYNPVIPREKIPSTLEQGEYDTAYKLWVAYNRLSDCFCKEGVVGGLAGGTIGAGIAGATGASILFPAAIGSSIGFVAGNYVREHYLYCYIKKFVLIDYNVNVNSTLTESFEIVSEGYDILFREMIPLPMEGRHKYINRVSLKYRNLNPRVLIAIWKMDEEARDSVQSVAEQPVQSAPGQSVQSAARQPVQSAARQPVKTKKAKPIKFLWKLPFDDHGDGYEKNPDRSAHENYLNRISNLLDDR